MGDFVLEFWYGMGGWGFVCTWLDDHVYSGRMGMGLEFGMLMLMKGMTGLLLPWWSGWTL